VKSEEISEGVILNYDSEGNLADIDIDNASKNLLLKMERTQFVLCPFSFFPLPRLIK